MAADSESLPDGTHPERVEVILPDGVRVEVRNSHRHYIERSVTLTSPDPEHDSNRIEVSVSASVSTYEPYARTPTLQFSAHPWWTRRQWEEAKRLGDRAWDEYERRFPNG